jgi:hypothetical protein
MRAPCRSTRNKLCVTALVSVVSAVVWAELTIGLLN